MSQWVGVCCLWMYLVGVCPSGRVAPVGVPSARVPGGCPSVFTSWMGVLYRVHVPGWGCMFPVGVHGGCPQRVFVCLSPMGVLAHFLACVTLWCCAGRAV